MPRYDLNGLGPQQFEEMSQGLLKEIIGAGTITFGPGPDGGREATFTGKAPYPSPADQWDGEWVFQVKFHDLDRVPPDKARSRLLAELREELEKITAKYKRPCDNYLLITNVPLTGVHESGTIDRIDAEIKPKFPSVSNIHVWGADEVHRHLCVHPNVRQNYLHLLATGDLIAELLGKTDRGDFATTVQLYLTVAYRQERFAQLDQAGEAGDAPLALEAVFIDTPLTVTSTPRHSRRPEADVVRIQQAREPVSALHLLTELDPLRVVIVGGPGEGKSTLVQCLAQIHRAILTGKWSELRGTGAEYVPRTARIPFRIILKDFAQALADAHGDLTVENFIGKDITERAGREISSEEVQRIVETNPTVLLLDGLDEVPNQRARAAVLETVADFVERVRVLDGDLQVIATTRPANYSRQFDPSEYIHTELVDLTSDLVYSYVERWIAARGLEPERAMRLRGGINECLGDEQLRLLMNTPLQVTIFVLIILAGGTPSRQREALFNDYLDVIYKREKAKSSALLRTERDLLFGVHQLAGYVLQSRASIAEGVRAELTRKELIRLIIDYVRSKDPLTPPDVMEAQAEQLLREAGDRLVLIVESRANAWGFELRSFQEFFAAGHLVETASDSEVRANRFEAIARSPYWRNTALFFAGKMGRLYRGEAANLIEVSRDIDRSGIDQFARTGAALAFELAVERAFGSNRRLQISALEVALSLLDDMPAMIWPHGYVRAIRALPGEDVREIVAPSLLTRFDGLSAEARAAIVVMLDASSRGAPRVRDLTLSAMADTDAYVAVTALVRAIASESDTDDIATTLGSSAIVAEPGRVGRAVARSFLEAPDRLVEIMRKAGVPDEAASGIVDGIAGVWPAATRNAAEFWITPPDGGDIWDELASFAALLAAVRDVERDARYRSQALFTETDLDPTRLKIALQRIQVDLPLLQRWRESATLKELRFAASVLYLRCSRPKREDLIEFESTTFRGDAFTLHRFANYLCTGDSVLRWYIHRFLAGDDHAELRAVRELTQRTRDENTAHGVAEALGELSRRLAALGDDVGAAFLRVGPAAIADRRQRQELDAFVNEKLGVSSLDISQLYGRHYVEIEDPEEFERIAAFSLELLEANDWKHASDIAELLAFASAKLEPSASEATVELITKLLRAPSSGSAAPEAVSAAWHLFPTAVAASGNDSDFHAIVRAFGRTPYDRVDVWVEPEHRVHLLHIAVASAVHGGEAALGAARTVVNVARSAENAESEAISLDDVRAIGFDQAAAVALADAGPVGRSAAIAMGLLAGTTEERWLEQAIAAIDSEPLALDDEVFSGTLAMLWAPEDEMLLNRYAHWLAGVTTSERAHGVRRTAAEVLLRFAESRPAAIQTDEALLGLPLAPY
jgi:hypothetical protein